VIDLGGALGLETDRLVESKDYDVVQGGATAVYSPPSVTPENDSIAVPGPARSRPTTSGWSTLTSAGHEGLVTHIGPA
jgi:hypothetical protein